MPDRREIDRASVISAMSRARQNEAAKATMLVQKALSPTTPVRVESKSYFRQKSTLSESLTHDTSTIAASCPSNLSIIEQQPDVVLDTTVNNSQTNNNNNNNVFPIEQMNMD